MCALGVCACVRASMHALTCVHVCVQVVEAEILMHYIILFTYFHKLLKLKFVTQYIHHFQHSNRIGTVFL